MSSLSEGNRATVTQLRSNAGLQERFRNWTWGKAVPGFKVAKPVALRFKMTRDDERRLLLLLRLDLPKMTLQSERALILGIS